MTELKFGGNDVKRLMYKDKDVSGSQMLESGTILLVLDNKLNWAKRRLGLDFDLLSPGDSITCKAFGVEKDWKNVSKIGVCVDEFNLTIIDISDLKNGPCKADDGNVTVKLEGKELTFTNNGKLSCASILVEAYNE